MACTVPEPISSQTPCFRHPPPSPSHAASPRLDCHAQRHPSSQEHPPRPPPIRRATSRAAPNGASHLPTPVSRARRFRPHTRIHAGTWARRHGPRTARRGAAMASSRAQGPTGRQAGGQAGRPADGWMYGAEGKKAGQARGGVGSVGPARGVDGWMGGWARLGGRWRRSWWRGLVGSAWAGWAAGWFARGCGLGWGEGISGSEVGGIGLSRHVGA
jgi:hypothetical protein